MHSNNQPIQSIIIRKATVNDAIPIANHLMLAMAEIVYLLINDRNYDKAIAFLLHWIQKEDNQYSYQNCWVADENGQVMGTINVYDGAKLALLRQPILNYIEAQYGHDISPEDETQTGEFYIDTLGVDPSFQGRGIGTLLLNEVIKTFDNRPHQSVGLLVSEGNDKARKLYINLGFVPIAKKVLLGKNLEHLQYNGTTITEL